MRLINQSTKKECRNWNCSSSSGTNIPKDTIINTSKSFAQLWKEFRIQSRLNSHFSFREERIVYFISGWATHHRSDCLWPRLRKSMKSSSVSSIHRYTLSVCLSVLRTDNIHRHHPSKTIPVHLCPSIIMWVCEGVCVCLLLWMIVSMHYSFHKSTSTARVKVYIIYFFHFLFPFWHRHHHHITNWT